MGSGTNLTQDIFQAFVTGRAIIAGEGDINQVAAQREIAAAGMEKVIAATVVHYINGTLAELHGIMGKSPSYAKPGSAEYDQTVANYKRAKQVLQVACGFSAANVAKW